MNNVLTWLYCRVITTGSLKVPDVLGLVDSEITAVLSMVLLLTSSPLMLTLKKFTNLRNNITKLLKYLKII